MTMTKTITVTIDTDGTVTFETDGYTGPDCAEATRALEIALGGEILRSERKPEYYNNLPPKQTINRT